MLFLALVSIRLKLRLFGRTLITELPYDEIMSAVSPMVKDYELFPQT